MALKFPFQKVKSRILGTVYRPRALVNFYSLSEDKWFPVWMIVDTGADYSLLPKWCSEVLGVDLVSDCKIFETTGVGGSERVYFLKKKALVKLGNWKRKITLGFLDTDDVPPLLGRHEFLEIFKTTFDEHEVIFEESK